MNIPVWQWSLILSLATIATGCASSSNPSLQNQQAQATESAITIDGSSTVYPLTDEVAKEFEFEQRGQVKIEVNFSGTGGGFRKFCAGETDINDASRPIKRDEMEACRKAGIEYVEIPVAFDGITVVVHPSNDWADDISVEELKLLWEPDAQGKVTRWSQIRQSWPDVPINLYGPGQDSGTFDYFTEVIVGESGSSRLDYTDSEDDYFLIRSVRNDPNALGYFGYAYYEESQQLLKALAIDGGDGPVLPSSQTLRSSEYQPLARPLFIYASINSIEQNPFFESFIEYYMNHARHLVKVVGYEPLPDEAYGLGLQHFEDRRKGTVFAGESKPRLTIEELLQLDAEF